MQNIQNCFTKNELFDILEIISQSLNVRTDEDLCLLLKRVQMHLPCDKVISGLGKMDSSSRFENFIKIVNLSFPSDWISLYMTKDYAAVDPILRYHFGKFKPQIWSETFQQATTEGEKEYRKAAISFDLAEGITIGEQCLRHAAGSFFCFAANSIDHSMRHALFIELLAPFLHVALMRTGFSTSTGELILSDRELEVLNWIKEGKTSWEISKILLISERTVNFHVQNTLAKLEASTRGQAVAIALEQGLICL